MTMSDVKLFKFPDGLGAMVLSFSDKVSEGVFLGGRLSGLVGRALRRRGGWLFIGGGGARGPAVLEIVSDIIS